MMMTPVKTAHPGYPCSRDTFYVGALKGVDRFSISRRFWTPGLSLNYYILITLFQLFPCITRDEPYK